ncbi:MAG: 1-phosphofructokinase [Clostridiales bacterium]|jgi:tagatose 6-phosphate kinase|nr:1-phosphofructokinase [Clostridiales bacterium]
MITTVTLNTAIDQLYQIDSCRTGGVNRVQSCIKTAGGKGVNVARVASLAGEKVIAAGIVGGFHGAYFKSLLAKDKIEGYFTDSGAETRCCINVRDKSTGEQTEFLEPGARLTEKALEDFYQTYLQCVEKSDVITISGSVPAGTPADYYSRLIEAARNAGKRVILDTSGAMLRDSIAARPTMIKPNADEIRQLNGIAVSSREELIQAAQKLHDGGIELVVISLGGDGALVVSDEGVFQGVCPKIEVVNTVGCGDSMVAGFAVGMVRKYPLEETIRFALSVASANALHEKTGFFREDDLKRLLSSTIVNRL